MKNDLFARLVFAVDHYFAERIVVSSFDILPYISADGRKCQVLAQIDLGTVGGIYHTEEFVVDLRSREQLCRLIAGLHASVILFSVEDGCVLHGACDAGQPVLGVRSVESLASVSVSQLKHASERALGADHTVVAAGGNDFVSPPARSNLSRKHIDRAGFAEDGTGHIVCEGQFRLCIMGEPGFQEFFSDLHSVYVEGIDAEAGCHPFG